MPERSPQILWRAKNWKMQLKKFGIHRQNAMNNTMLEEKTFYLNNRQAVRDRHSNIFLVWAWRGSVSSNWESFPVQ
jgi:hypothetical protein